MHLVELFAGPPLEVNDNLRNSLLDVLTPLAAQKWPFVTIKQIIKKMRDFRTGIALDRGLVMDLLDPTKMKLVQKIEGDRIYLNTGGAPQQSVNARDKEKQQNDLHKSATDQAKKAVGDQGGPAATAQKQAVSDTGGPL